MEKTITELIFDEINAINSTKEKWDASYLSERLLNLSVLYSNLTLRIAEKESAYFKVLDLSLGRTIQTDKGIQPISVARAEVAAKAGNEYAELRKAQNLEKAVVECLRSLKRYIKIKSNEQEASYNL